MKKYRNFDGLDAKFAQNGHSKRCLGLILRKNRHKIIGPSRGEIYMSLIGRLVAIEEFPKK